MSDVTDAEREALHKMLDEAIDARERIPTDGFARDRLRSAASLLFKRLVGQHVVEVHHADDSLSRKPNDRLGRLVSICVWAGYTLPDVGDGNLTRAEVWQFANELNDLRLTAPKALPGWLRPTGSKLKSPDELRLIALAVSWVKALNVFLGKNQTTLAKEDVAKAFGISSKTVGKWEALIEKKPIFASQLEAATAGKDGPGAKCAFLVDGDKNLLVTVDSYLAHLTRHGQEYQNLFGKKL
jgi:organic hydroperoxide reductase OsmC/OhrA